MSGRQFRCMICLNRDQLHSHEWLLSPLVDLIPFFFKKLNEIDVFIFTYILL